ncbi:twin-arginine translocase TatA/TatE family subunit [Granulicoccus sp. GXG6511]|uniref:twin-arginine translocase TatA/TatE family subunit n=1 Tax=Granulicoccus sp. GXG6511 TaxID=3381351 RepID=UPI003D7D57F0
MTPLVFGLGPMELVIILVVVLLLFGGSRLAGLGRSSGRAIREFKEETRGLKAEDEAKKAADRPRGIEDAGATRPDVADAEIVEPKPRPEDQR